MFQTFKRYLSLVKFSHTLFALPFAAVGFTIGVLDNPAVSLAPLAIKVLFCMVFARNTAMAFNRLIDAPIDEKNSRTAIREIPSGQLKPAQVWFFAAINALAFMVTAYFINPLCFYLSPVALVVILGYSFTKRFTPLCHLVLGLGLALAPIGAYMAVTGTVIWPILFLGFAVMSWVGGFDVIYALQDESFDKEHSLYSIPAWLGAKKALQVSRLLHGLSIIALLAFASFMTTTYVINVYWFIPGVLFFMGMIIYQHTLVRPNDLRHVNLAFFTSNGLASLVFGTLAIISFLFP